MMNNYLSIDIGGTNIKYGILNRSGILIKSGLQNTPTKDIKSFSTLIKQIITEFSSEIRGVAFSVPGKVDAATGIVSHGGSLPFLDGINFRDEFGTRAIPVSIENDGKAAALAELWLGNLVGINSGVAIVLGTGVGGGIILDGKLLYGAHLQAGEFSFILDDYNKTDFMKSAMGLNLSAVEMIKRIGSEAGLHDIKDGLEVFNLINKKDPVAWSIFFDYADRVAKLILSLQSILDVDRFVIGGGISAQPIVTKSIIEAKNQILSANSLIRDTFEKFEIFPAKFANNANLFGALYSFFLQIDSGEISEQVV
ncbi:ROK family protein [Oenococcus oeni]